MKLTVAIAVVFAILGLVAAHGTVHQPVARQTRWRYDASAVPNYDDVGVYCGGFSVSRNSRSIAMNSMICTVC